MSFGLGHGRELSIEGVGFVREDLPAFDPSDRAGSLIDPRAWFEEPTRRFELEIGSGKGTFLLQQAVLQPETNFLGIEWAGEFFRYAADRIRRRQLTNVKMLHDDASEFIRFRVPDGVCSIVHLYFSDPWPKKRHHKRRVVQDQSLRDFHRVLEPAGLLHLVTDHDDLWAWYEDHVARVEDLFERLPFQPPASAGEGEVVGTNFERKYAREGRPFHAMTLKKR
ncbi:MAG: tRNA (guanosine(46)-N7)-methyltransferase TrmB [Planctomycetota bacterium]